MTALGQSTNPPPNPGPSADKGARVPGGSRVYAVGDIHGRSDLLARLHGLILGDAREGARARNVVVYVGDYVDRGPDSFGVVDMLLNDPLPGFERHHLKGNHDEFLLRFLDGGDQGDSWMWNGGGATLDSYGIDGADEATFGDELAALSRAFADAIPASHRAFFDELALSHREGDYLFVHAGVRPGVALDRQNAHDLMWIRDEFLDSDADFGAFVIHGHSIRAEPEVRANRIGIDTGAWRSGRLTAVVLDGATRRFLQT